MNLLLFILPAFLMYLLGYRFYAPYLARRFGENDSRPTPAVIKNDGVDYVPTRPHILFAHHFSAIAAAGPILGPTWALLYGVVPAWLWIVLGGIFLGAAHDFACLFVAIREGGRSIAEVARKTLGTTAFICYVLFLLFNLVIVNATFINLTAVSLTSMRTPESLGLPGPPFHREQERGRGVVAHLAGHPGVSDADGRPAGVHGHLDQPEPRAAPHADHGPGRLA